MTANHGFIQPSRRPGELGIHSLDRCHMVVPDLKDAQDFYSGFGLDVREEGNNLGLYTHGSPHKWVSIGEGPRKKFGYFSFGLFEEDFAPFAKRLQDQGVARIDPPKDQESNGIWFRDPDGNLLEAKIAEKSSPSAKSEFTAVSVPGGQRGAPYRRDAGRVHPRRLSHTLLFTPDVSRAIDFYSRVLGLRLSDRSGEGIAFMHGIHGSDHHLVAFAKSNAPGHHHFSWDVGSIMDVGLGAMLMLEKGYDRGWGLGRHVLGSNYFHYIRDPWGSYSEYSADIDFVPVDHDWQAGDHPPEDSLYVWGPNLPEDFIHNYEA
ncbi:MAG: metapyrocatechase [Rhizobiales bacterium 62-17]|nr:VOC family protein [Hyphomicrobiales bacterium]OJY00873.1 MAG: metapyrocatechase [Rhizobiales bacterium 62-17]